MKSLIIFYFLVSFVSCNEKILFNIPKNVDVKEPSSPIVKVYDLNVSEGDRILYMTKAGSALSSIYIENKEISANERVLTDFEKIPQLELYHFNNGSIRGDRFYYISDTNTLRYSFDGISSGEIFSDEILNGYATSLIFHSGFLFHKKVTANIGNAHYFSVKRNLTESIVDRLGLVNGNMAINHSSPLDNYDFNFCASNPASCSSTPFQWVSKVIMLSDKETVIGIISRLVQISGASYLIPFYSFKMTEESAQMSLLPASFTPRERQILGDIQLVNGYLRSRIYRDDQRILFNYKDLAYNKLYFFSMNHDSSELIKNREFVGDLPSSFSYTHNHSSSNNEDDLAEWHRYATVRYTTSAGERFDFLVNGSWRTSPSFNSFLASENGKFKLHKDKASGWNFIARTADSNKIIWCDNDFDNCQEVVTQGHNANQMNLFLSEKGAFAYTADNLTEYQAGEVIRTYSFNDSASGGHLSQQFSYFREGSLCFHRVDDNSDHKRIIYVFDDELKPRQIAEALDSDVSTNPITDAGKEYYMGYIKVLLSTFGIYFNPP